MTMDYIVMEICHGGANNFVIFQKLLRVSNKLKENGAI